MTSVLTAWIFYRIFQSGVAIRLLVPFYLVTVLSVSVGLYNTVLWKDIPFALLVVFWAFFTAELYEKKRAGRLCWTVEKSLALILLLVALGLVRHNGLIYLLFVPIVFVVAGIVRPGRKVVFFAAGTTLAGAAVFLFIWSRGGFHSGFLIHQGQLYLSNLFDSGADTVLTRFWHNYWGVLDINQTASKWDLFHFYLNDRYSYRFLQHAGWNDVYGYLTKPAGIWKSLRELAMTVYWASYKTPLVYFVWNQVWTLFLYIFCILGFKWLPRSALFSSIILVQVVALSVLLNVLNWRYYYFCSLASYFIIPVLFLDIHRLRSKNV